jgi:hypothetical protein
MPDAGADCELILDQPVVDDFQLPVLGVDA